MLCHHAGMTSIEAAFRTLPGTAAAVGVSGRHTIVVDRPEGRAGGRGLGHSGGQVLALAIGGCLCNDLRYLAAEEGLALGDISVDVSLTIEEPHVTGATVRVAVDAPTGVDTAALLQRAAAASTVGLSVIRGFPISVGPAHSPPPRPAAL